MAGLLRDWARAGVLAGTLALCCACSAESLGGKLPLRRDAEPVQDGSLWMPSLLLLGLAAVAGGYALWRRGGGALARAAAARRNEHAVTRLSSHALTPQASVHAVQWNGEEYLLGCTAQQVTLLARRPLGAGEGEKP